MVSAHVKVTAKLGEEKSVQQAETIVTGSSLQQLDTKAFALECLRRRMRLSNTDMLEYESVLRMVEHLRHRNPECWGTVGAYIPTLKMICKVLESSPDELVRSIGRQTKTGLSRYSLPSTSTGSRGTMRPALG